MPYVSALIHPLSLTAMITEINRMVRENMEPNAIRAAMQAHVEKHSPNQPYCDRMLATAFSRANPLSPADALHREKRAEHRASIQRKPVRFLEATAAKQRHTYLRQMVGSGMLVGAKGCPPYKGTAERLVKDGLATSKRHHNIGWGSNSPYGLTRLYITEKGEAELARLNKNEARRQKKFGLT